MRIHRITYPDINNGLGCRVSLWVSGCEHCCKGCHNPETWSFESGREFTDDDKKILFEILSKPYIKGITLTGGDPVYSHKEIVLLLKEIREKFPTKDVWLYTGFDIGFIEKRGFSGILDYIDVVVDGPYIEMLRDVSLAFRGSSNQTIWEKVDGKFEISKLNGAK